MKKILFLDIENCPQTAETLFAFCQEYHLVQLVYATKNLTIDIDQLNSLIPYIQAKKLNIFKMPCVGKNSADFGLAFIAGQFSQRYKPSDMKFDIMSNDKQISYIVEMLKKNGFNSELLKVQRAINKSESSKNEQTDQSIKSKKTNPPRNLADKPTIDVPILIKDDQIDTGSKIKFEKTELQKGGVVSAENFSEKQKINNTHIPRVNVNRYLIKNQELMRLATYLNRLDDKKPKFLAAFSVHLKKVFPKSDPEEYVSKLLEAGMIQLDGRKIIYRIPLTMH